MSLSMHGRALVARHCEKICESLVALLASERKQNGILSQLFAALMDHLTTLQGNPKDDGDSEYAMKTRTQLCHSLCARAQVYSSCMSVLSSHCDKIILTLVESLANSSSLETFPSCNLQRLAENGGDRAAKRSWAMLTFFAGGTSGEYAKFGKHDSLGHSLVTIQQKRRRRALNNWHFCQSFQRCLSQIPRLPRSAGLRLHTALQIGDLEQMSLDVGSMELECMKRFHVLTGVLFVATQAEFSTFMEFERLASLAVATSSRQVLRIAQSLRYHDQSCDGDSTRNDVRRAKLVELLGVSSTFCCGLFGFVLRQTPGTRSDKWNVVLSRIRDLFLSSISSPMVNHAIALSGIIESSLSMFSGTCRSIVTTSSGLSVLSGYLTQAFTNFVLRSRQFILEESKDNSRLFR